ncbi:putative FxsA cytoplasmic membrane protein [Sinorhizobium fredii NGR234]|uniref:FxsA cytoplasmic membrane protein n=1 Tax=Sinorhizobium fredii (strain NBRC 101917 / NGR234) TaxID=394 RepID=C3MB77_SINFN|nr:FxsA family protein [Sinorhizobium fredii]ACP27086.1 putative FxsA cytoplasmic membrane protein [Sinorhizobium fredii NGR234]
MRSLIIPLVILGLPIAEIAGFVVVGRELGLAMTLLLVLLSGVAGVLLLRIQGLGTLRRVQDAARAGKDPGPDLLGGALIFVGAILLIVPGFITDIAGLILFLPPIRRAIASFLQTRLTILTTGSGFYYGSGARSDRPRGPAIIDLDSDEFSRKNDDENGPSPPSNRISR